jgi:rhodanese-related sulfurtransferase
MAAGLSRDEVARLQAAGAQVVEVLPRAEYEWKHIAGAVSLPLNQMDEKSVAGRLDRGTPVITYCQDFQ